ncbi:MAG: DeoR/GlpR family DNA-binding transcription regulator [Nocardioidaceae bacterium]
MTDNVVAVLAHRRYERILDTLRTRGPVEVRVFADLLRVSEATVRRDLHRLERDGLLNRVRGGAVLSDQAAAPFAQLPTAEQPDRDSVAAHAADLVRDGDVLLLDIGTTVHRMSVQLHGRDVTVMTPSLAVYDELAADRAVELILLGGVVRRSHRSMVGFLTEHALRQVHAQRLFLGASGIRPDGTVLETTVADVPVKQAMLAAADQVVLLVDQGKFPGHGIARVCGARDVDALVTTEGADPRSLSTFREAGTAVILA